MRNWGLMVRCVFVCAVVAVIAFGTTVYAGKVKDCPPKPQFCPLLWAPVICDDGKVYPNECWAQKRCATG